MIPPSVPLVIYAVLTQGSIGKLFMAAVIPGLIAMTGYMLVIKLLVTLDPKAGPASEAQLGREMPQGHHRRGAR